MSVTFVGQAAVASGLHLRRRDGMTLTGSMSFARLQPRLPIWRDHDADLECGEVVFLEHDRARGLQMVGVIDRLGEDDDRRYLSVG